jgi:hypothetical protein
VSVGSLIRRAGSEILVRVSSPSDKQSDVPAGGSDPAPRPTRRVFTSAYKLATVAEYENAPNGEKGAVLRREGLYSSHISLNGRGLVTPVCYPVTRRSRRLRRNAERNRLS